MAQYPFITLDVFTRDRFRGNQLAVFPDARGLDSETMQAIAREFKYSEITFVLPPSDPANTAQVRIFTPTAEIPFAGHPNVGTGFVMARQDDVFGSRPGDRLRFEEKAGIVDVTVHRDADGSVSGAAIVAPEPLSVAESMSAERLATIIGLPPGGVATHNHAPLLLSVGLPFVVAEITDLKALAMATPDTSRFADAAKDYANIPGRLSVFLYVRPEATPWQLRARMFAPLGNIPEDPATGSASAALAAYLVSRETASTETTELTIDQGVEMGRASQIRLRVTSTDGGPARVHVIGDCVEMMRGVISV